MKKINDTGNLRGFYEEVNIKKTTVTFLNDPVEDYYVESRLAGLSALVPRDPGAVLDAGGGSGSFFRLLCDRLDLDFRDITVLDWAIAEIERPDHAKLDPAKHFFIQGDVQALPVKSGAVDLIFNSEVIEHLPPERSVEMLKDFLRVLRPGGHLLITTPNGTDYRRILQETALSLLLFLGGKKIGSLDDREYLKSRLFRKYLKFTGHSHVNVEAIEKKGLVGHTNVLPPSKIKAQLKEAGFTVTKTAFSIFIPLAHIPFVNRKRAYARSLFFAEKLIKTLRLGKFFLSCQMYLAVKG
ncbi:MAG: methyltransferase domain-containing protein [Candidatus Omnitrophica bacterium]|nr:methyltransferase domain-containing protein [Candidatus Omnitrophota bacterium]